MGEQGYPLSQQHELIIDLYILLSQWQLYRHGDRSAVSTFPNDPYPESMWPQGYGELTEVSHCVHNYTLNY